MASRPLPPGRRGRGSRTASALHLPLPLPEVKLLDVQDATAVAASSTSSVVEQIREAEKREQRGTVEPEHESTAQHADTEPSPVRSVKAFVASLQAEAASVSMAAAASSGITTQPTTTAAVVGSAAVRHNVEPGKVPYIARPHYTPPPTAEHTKLVTAPVNSPAEEAPAKETATPPIRDLPPRQSITAAARGHPVPVVTPVPLSPPTLPTPPPQQQPLVVPAFDGFHPFQLLMPVYSVPVVPESVECVFDDEAVEMQKNIMKVVKKVFGKDRVRLEDFKINSRLYGNNFMEPVAYFESLAKDFGGNRALLLVPCLLCLQPDYMKRNSLLLAARTYRSRNLTKLEGTCDTVAPVETTASGSSDCGLNSPDPKPTVLGIEQPSIVESMGSTPQESEAAIHEQEPLVIDAAHPVAAVEEEEATAPPVAATASRDGHKCMAEDPADMYFPPADELDQVPVAAKDAQSPNDDPVIAEPACESLGHVDEPPVVQATLRSVVQAPQPIELVVTTETPVSAFAIETVVDFGPVPVPVVSTPVVEDAAPEPPKPLLMEPPTEEALGDEVKPIAAAPTASVTILETATPTVPSVSAPSATLHQLPSVSDAHTLPSPFATTAALPLVVQPSPLPLPSTSLSVEAVDAHPHSQPVRRQSTLNLFGEEIGDDDTDEDATTTDTMEEEPTKPAHITTDTTTTATPPLSASSSSVSSYHEAESLFGEAIPAEAKRSVSFSNAPGIPLATKPQRRSSTGMLFGFASVGGDSGSDSDDSDSEFSD